MGSRPGKMAGLAQAIARRPARKPARGWSAVKPRGRFQRIKILRACGGERCFLDPQRLAFPICQRCRGQVCSCRADCRGLLSAFRRACQTHCGWKRAGMRDIAARRLATARKAVLRARREGCSWVRTGAAAQDILRGGVGCKCP